MVRVNRLVEIDSKTRARLNDVGTKAGLGGCRNCEDNWCWKECHTTYFREGTGCFPLCEECWESMTPGQRLPFYLSMLENWFRGGMDRSEADEIRRQVIDAVMEGG